MHEVITQLIGFGGLAAFLISFQVRSNRGLFLLQILGNLMFMLQFLLLGAYSGCLSLGIGAVRNVLASHFNEWGWTRWKGWPVIFIAAFVGVTMYTWSGWPSLLPLAAMSTATIAFWTNNALNIRKANLFVASPAWVVYDILFLTYAGILNEVITISSILISIWRFGWKNLGDPDSGFSE